MKTVFEYVGGAIAYIIGSALVGGIVVVILAGAQSVFGLGWHATLGILLLLFLAAAVKLAR